MLVKEYKLAFVKSVLGSRISCTAWCQNLLAMQEARVRSLGQEDPLEKGVAIQYSYLENCMDRGNWQATVHRVAKSQTQLSN